MTLLERIIQALLAAAGEQELPRHGEVIITIQDDRPVLVQITSKHKPKP